jgi:indolepyruvate ferredoxin oxidoreductase beta subunit
MKELNLIISGVGGQGNLLLETIIGSCAIESGLRVKASDTFGAAQRGGSVLSQIRLCNLNETVSALVPQGKCDVILGLEPGEALRTAGKYLCEDGFVIVNTSNILPVTVKIGQWENPYPSFQMIHKLLKNATSNVIALDATSIAKTVAGSERFLNVFMVGAFAAQKILPIDIETYKRVIKEATGIFAEKNLRAFDAGFEQCSA